MTKKETNIQTKVMNVKNKVSAPRKEKFLVIDSGKGIVL